MENNKVISLFAGDILKQFTCPQGHQKHNFERFLDMSLPFTPKSSQSAFSYSYSNQGPLKLHDMLYEFLGVEHI